MAAALLGIPLFTFSKRPIVGLLDVAIEWWLSSSLSKSNVDHFSNSKFFKKRGKFS